MGEVIHVDENGKVRKDSKFKTAYENAKIKAQKFWEDCKENKEVIIAVGSVAVPTVVEVTKMIIKGSNRRTDDDRRKKQMWDPVEGHWWKLRRELSSSEYLEVEHRVKNGESRGEVLYDMGVLKK